MKNELVELDGEQLANLLRAGIYRLFEKTDLLTRSMYFRFPTAIREPICR